VGTLWAKRERIMVLLEPKSSSHAPPKSVAELGWSRNTVGLEGCQEDPKRIMVPILEIPSWLMD
jgi:hypothetical protein